MPAGWASPRIPAQKPDGTGITRLTNDPAYDDQATFSSDSKSLVFVSTRGGGVANLWTMNLDTLRVQRLTSGTGGDYRPSWAPLGRGSDRGKDERLPMAEADSRRAVRIPRMDTGQSLAAFAFRRSTRRQEAEGR